MRFFRRLAGFLGLGRDDDDGSSGDARQDGSGGGGPGGGNDDERNGTSVHRGSSRGFGVQIPVAVERANPGPVLVPCDPAEGGVQGFRWYTRRLRIDEDGDVADEFLEEILPSPAWNHARMPTFQAKLNHRPPPYMDMRKQVILGDGNLQQSLEYQDRLRWV